MPDQTVDPLDSKLDVNLRVADLDASVEWYGRVFGCEPIYRGVDRTLEGVATSMACFRLGGVKIWLLPRREAPSPSAPQRVGLAFMTRQRLAPLRALLESRGARFDDTPIPDFPADAAGVRQGQDAEFMYVLDPDGHKLEFCRSF
jgi:catechol 2,3-dioxygenase-like lactoylglutathione lyase family enzyme